MAVVYMDSFADHDDLTWGERDINIFMREWLVEATCDVCGLEVFRIKKFLWWRGKRHIVVCEDCAEHTMNGLNRDLIELKGNKEVKDKPSYLYGVLTISKELIRLKSVVDDYSRRIVELQQIIARRD